MPGDVRLDRRGGAGHPFGKPILEVHADPDLAGSPLVDAPIADIVEHVVDVSFARLTSFRVHFEAWALRKG